MKSLAMRSFLVDGQEMSYGELLLKCVNSPPKEGFSPEEMEKRLKLVRKLNEAKDTVELEDAEANDLKRCTSEMRWNVLNEDLKKMLDDVKAL